MSATGEIATIGREGWAVSLGTALERWGRRRAVRARLATVQRATEARERRAEPAERVFLDAHAEFMRAFERAAALARLYRG